MHTVTVIGASLAGLYAARALRAEGYAGRLVLVGEERHRPYDRPPLSKAFLTGAADADALALADDEETAGLALDLRTGARAVRLDPRARSVTLASGEEIRTDGVVLATGAAPRTLPGPVPGKVHTLRTLDDARALRAALTAGPVRVVVIGGGFLGAETASSCAALGHDVTVVEAAPLPSYRSWARRWPGSAPRSTPITGCGCSPAPGWRGCARTVRRTPSPRSRWPTGGCSPPRWSSSPSGSARAPAGWRAAGCRSTTGCAATRAG